MSSRAFSLGLGNSIFLSIRPAVQHSGHETERIKLKIAYLVESEHHQEYPNGWWPSEPAFSSIIINLHLPPTDDKGDYLDTACALKSIKLIQQLEHSTLNLRRS